MKLSLAHLAALLLAAEEAAAHTWNEQFQVIGSDGKYAGNYGYPRGYVARTDPGFNGDSMKYQLPPVGAPRTRITADDLLCHPNQRAAKQSSDKYPRLTAAPGSFVAMKYLENGHVSFPNTPPGKPEKGGTVFVYGTTQPKSDEKLVDVLKWTTDGKGGDGRGQLLTAQTYDDGRCHQITSASQISTDRQKEYPDNGQELWCETDLKIPEKASTGTMTVYWVWQWQTEPNVDQSVPQGKDEYYTTCSDFNIVADAKLNVQGTAKFALNQQDAMASAPQNYQNRKALTQSPIIQTAGGTQGAASPTSMSAPAAGGATGAPAQTSSTPTQTTGTGSIQIPTLSARPGETASVSAAPAQGNADAGSDGFVTVTVTEKIYITQEVYMTKTVQPNKVRAVPTDGAVKERLRRGRFYRE